MIHMTESRIYPMVSTIQGLLDLVLYGFKRLFFRYGLTVVYSKQTKNIQTFTSAHKFTKPPEPAQPAKSVPREAF